MKTGYNILSLAMAIGLSGCLGFDLSDHDPGKLQNIAGVWSVTGYTIDGKDSIQVMHDIKADLFTFYIAKDGRDNIRNFGAEINYKDSIYRYEYRSVRYQYSHENKTIFISAVGSRPYLIDTVNNKNLEWYGSYRFPIDKYKDFDWQIIELQYQTSLVLRLNDNGHAFELSMKYLKNAPIF